MSAARLVIFDVDGTLVDSIGAIQTAMRESFAAAGLASPVADQVRGIVGLSLPVAIARLAPGLDAAALAGLVQGYKDAYNARVARDGRGADSPLFPGARAALDRLASAGTLLAVATGKSRRGLDGLIAAHGLAGMFASTQVADDHPSKPHPSMIHACLRETGIAAADAVIIGDTEFDIDMGLAAGIGTIGVRWGYHPAERLARAGALIDGFDHLDAALARIWQDA